MWFLSLPLRECGLKYYIRVKTKGATRHSPCGSVDWNNSTAFYNFYCIRHSPCGSVDWNRQEYDDLKGKYVTPLAGVWIEITPFAALTGHDAVTPLAGVWIEIFGYHSLPSVISSLPLRECGLKYCRDSQESLLSLVTPLAGVWIEIAVHLPYAFGIKVTPLAGVWIEITVWGSPAADMTCHSPCGSVD